MPKECIEPWRYADGVVRVSGICIPPHISRDHPRFRALAPYGLKTAREFFDEQEAGYGGSSID